MFKFVLDPCAELLDIADTLIEVALSTRWHKVVEIVDCVVEYHFRHSFPISAIDTLRISNGMIDLHVLDVDFLATICAVSFVFFEHALP